MFRGSAGATGRLLIGPCEPTIVHMSDMNLPAPVPASPASEQERVALLDALRGVSILGIALANVLFFAVPIGRLMSWQWGNVSVSDGIVRRAVTFFAENQFFPIFAMLFGAGLASQYARARQAQRGFAGLCVRRLLVLLAFGVAHGVLLWFGDILSLYALLGFVACLFCGRSPRVLIIGAATLLMVPLLLQVIMTLSDPYAPPKSLDEQRQELAAELQARAAEADSKEKAAMTDRVIAWLDFLADDLGVYRSESMGRIILHRSIYFLVISPYAAIVHMGWSAMGFMLLGVYLFRRGLLSESEQLVHFYRRLAMIGMLPGVALQVAALILHITGSKTAWISCIEFACVYLGSYGMALGYVGIMFLLYQRPVWKRRLKPLVAVGRMSLTNYIGSSFLFGLIFYGYGLGLMGRVSLLTTQLLAVAVMVSLTIFSVIWLRRFQYGPLEWLWRVFTYLRLLPIRRQADEDGSGVSTAEPGTGRDSA